MKLIVLCFLVGSVVAVPNRQSRASALDLLSELEDIVQEEGREIIAQLLNVIHHVEDGVLQIKNLVPKIYEKVHEEANEVLNGLKKITDELEELLGKKKALLGFDLLSGLTELPGGVRLSTVLNVLSLANKAHTVAEDAKKFVPRLQDTLKKIQEKFEDHANKFAKRIVQELGLQEFVSRSVINKIENLFDKVEDEGHVLILDILHQIEKTFDILKEKLPELYEQLEAGIDEVRSEIHELVNEIEKSLVMRGFSLLDIAGDVTGGTSLSTAFKVMSLIDKFNTVVQDAKHFQPRAEAFLQHSVKQVAERAQTFFSHAADKFLEF